MLEDFNKRVDGCNQQIKPGVVYLNPRASMLDHDFSTSSAVLMTTTPVNDMSISPVLSEMTADIPRWHQPLRTVEDHLSIIGGHFTAGRPHGLQWSGAQFQYPIRRLFVRSREVSKPRDWQFKLSYRFEISHAHGQPMLPMCLSNFGAIG